jgi:16S rRNA (guanine527-N7)-methyltransferase
MSHRTLLEPLGLEDLAIQRLAAYLDVLAFWSSRVNLTGAATDDERVRVLVASVLPALPLVQPGRLIDVGSGNGSPGLVFAALCDELEVTLLEPRLKRWAFLREAARAMKCPGVDVRRERHDTYSGQAAQTVTLRALRLPLATLGPLVERGGRLLVFGSELEPGEPFVPEPGAGGATCSVFRRCST